MEHQQFDTLPNGTKFWSGMVTGIWLIKIPEVTSTEDDKLYNSVDAETGNLFFYRDSDQVVIEKTQEAA